MARKKVVTPSPRPRARRPAVVPLAVLDVVGTTYHAYRGRVNSIKSGRVVDLVLEPMNPYDPMAIRVDLDGEVLGYLRAQGSTDEVDATYLKNAGKVSVIHRLLQANIPMSAVIARVPEIQIVVGVAKVR